MCRNDVEKITHNALPIPKEPDRPPTEAARFRAALTSEVQSNVTHSPDLDRPCAHVAVLPTRPRHLLAVVPVPMSAAELTHAAYLKAKAELHPFAVLPKAAQPFADKEYSDER
jgi:hypothetical protein